MWSPQRNTFKATKGCTLFSCYITSDQGLCTWRDRFQLKRYILYICKCVTCKHHANMFLKFRFYRITVTPWTFYCKVPSNVAGRSLESVYCAASVLMDHILWTRKWVSLHSCISMIGKVQITNRYDVVSRYVPQS